MTLSAGISLLGCSETSVKFDLITKVQKTSRVRWNKNRYLIDNRKCKYKNWNHNFEVASSDAKH